ncbi:hypothetical protein [Deinococcus cellulosilyticus]|uniref:Uncharacterized protein n=1 Tax=Deinococcus cellulosilyticus (strain DSM 18568 / NBRC 106333 / KACC 11606 / 5516J-15) TaxID=1223518 RepID=A0A511MYA4_DEIC1|nr:hypothetical protein [Deinococcus cellulosilyticus]GEM45331.1 hypothetical protein DC3_09660 [Deinococcus cellulosilyticus NBRC 106333 = KACC 11606]
MSGEKRGPKQKKRCFAGGYRIDGVECTPEEFAAVVLPRLADYLVRSHIEEQQAAARRAS